MSDMVELTCKNHPKARYLTKREFGRSLHWISADTDFVREVLAADGSALSGTGKPWAEVPDEVLSNFTAPRYECPCPASDLVEVTELASKSE